MRWDFLWHMRGAFELSDATSNSAALDALAAMLRSQRKPVSESSDSHLKFSDPLWNHHFSGNWKAMVIYDRGTFQIDTDGNRRVLRYCLRSWHGFLFCLFASVIAGMFGIAAHQPMLGLKAFAWLYGGNMALAYFRIPSLIHSTVFSAAISAGRSEQSVNKT